MGTSPTSLKAKVWEGSSEPADWMVEASDSTGALQTPGATAFNLYVSGSAIGNNKVKIDDWTVESTE